MKKIKIFLGGYINFTNAQNLNCLALAQHLDKKKFVVYTLTVFSGDRKTPEIDGSKIFNCFKPHRISKYIGYLWGISNCDVAYLSKGEITNWCKLWLKILGKKSFTTIEGILDEEVMSNAIRFHGSKEKALQFYNVSDKLYSITKYMKNYNKTKYNIHSENKILYLGTEINTFINESKKPGALKNIILIGNDLIRKGVHDYFKIANKFPNIMFHIVGTGNGRIDVNQIIKEKNISNIIYHGGKIHKDLVKLLKNMDIHLFPSKSEGFPKVTLETAAAGLPSIVYSDYGASEWITNNHDGFVVDSYKDIIKVIQSLLDHPDLLQSTSKNAIEMAKRFDWKILVKEWEEVIERIYSKYYSLRPKGNNYIS